MRQSTFVVIFLVKLPSLFITGLWLCFSTIAYAQAAPTELYPEIVDKKSLELLNVTQFAQTVFKKPYQFTDIKILQITELLLAHFEQNFTPSDPLNPDLNKYIPQKIGIGSMTTGFQLPDLIPDKHIRRLAGYTDWQAARSHMP